MKPMKQFMEECSTVLSRGDDLDHDQQTMLYHLVEEALGRITYLEASFNNKFA